MMNRLPFRAGRASLALLTTALLAACASTPLPNSALEDARAELHTAAADPLIAATAPNELTRAQQEITNGDAAFNAKKDTATVDHFAYLAHQRTQAAIQAAQAVRSDRMAAEAQTQRDRIVLASRTREAEQAKASADRREDGCGRRAAGGAGVAAAGRRAAGPARRAAGQADRPRHGADDRRRAVRHRPCHAEARRDADDRRSRRVHAAASGTQGAGRGLHRQRRQRRDEPGNCRNAVRPRSATRSRCATCRRTAS